MIDFGKMTERVTVQTLTNSVNSMRETVQTPSTYATRWASVEGVSSREYYSQGQQRLEVSHRVRMRYLEGLDSTMQISWRGRTLQIVSVLEHGRRSAHELLCTEQVDP